MGNSSKKEDKQLDDVRLNALKIATNMTEEEIREWHEIFLVILDFYNYNLSMLIK